MRNPNSHKGENGKVLVIAGSDFYHGAAYLCSTAALRCGVDLVHVMTSEKSANALAALSCELILKPYSGSCFSSEHVLDALSFAEWADVVLIGPGLGNSKETILAVKEFLLKNTKPVVIDADALLAVDSHLMHNAVLTPHKKELSYFLESEGDVSSLLLKNSSKDTIILLKGPIDLISNGTKIHENHTGTASMTKGGSGDVLAGICAGLLALGKDKFQAAKDAAYYNGKIGERLSSEKGHGWLTSEMLDLIPHALMHANGNTYTNW